MISKKYMESIGLSPDQVSKLSELQKKEAEYMRFLERLHITHVGAIMSKTEVDKIDFSDEGLLREKTLIEYGDLIPREYR